MSSIKENGIGSNYRTLENDPISHLNDPRIKVEIYPGAWGSVHASVSCPELNYDSGLQVFQTDQEANLYAINLHNKLKAKLDSMMESIMVRILREMS